MSVGVRRKLIVKDGHGERDVLLVGTVSVGRDPSCEISANDPALSRHHAEFLETARGVLVRDLRSQNGIKVNNVVVREALLNPGDVVQVAALMLRYVEDGVAPETVPLPAPNAAAERTIQLGEPPAHIDGPPAHIDGPPAHLGGPPAAPPPAPSPAVPPVPDAAGAAAHLVAAKPPAPEPKPSAIDDSTVVAPPPAPPKASAPVPLASLVGTPPAPTKGDSDRTNVMEMLPPLPAALSGSSPQAGARSTNVLPVALPTPSVPAAPARPRVSATERAAQELAATKVKPATHSSWAARVLLRVLLLTLIVSLLSAVPLMIWHQQQMSADAVSRATAIANLLAADASLALTTGKDLESAPDDVLGQSGVIAARVLNLDGRVLAPASRSAETIEYIPGVNAAPNDILRLRAEWNGDRLEVVRPVAAKGAPRAALAWVTISPTTEFNGSSVVVTAPVVVVSLLLGWIVATILTRSTQRGFAKLNEDVELALSGRADVVRDPLGAKPLTDLTNTINYLLARLHGLSSELGTPPAKSTLAVAAAPAPPPVMPPVVIPPSETPTPIMGTAPPPRPAPAPPARQPTAAAPMGAPASSAAPPAAAYPAAASAPAAGPAGSVAGVEARLLVDTAFLVTEASPGCATLLGVRPDALVGRHLLDAVADRQIADAVLGCLSALPPAGERQAVTADAGGRRLVATVSRAGKNKPITITLQPAE
jgi:hypothetical protein